MKLLEVPAGFSFGKLERSDDAGGFDCGHKDTNDFLKDDALEYQRNNLAVTYVLRAASNKVVGFVSLAMGAIRTDGASEIVIPSVRIRQYPGLKIGQLGVAMEMQRRGLGEALVLAAIKLADDFKERVGCRFVLVDSYPERTGFYEKLHFKPMYSSLREQKTMPMYFVL